MESSHSPEASSRKLTDSKLKTDKAKTESTEDCAGISSGGLTGGLSISSVTALPLVELMCWVGLPSHL